MTRPFEEIVAEHGLVVMRVLRSVLGFDDADDAWSETFIAAMRAYPDLRQGSNIRGWLVTIAHHKAIDQIRKTNRSPRPRDGLPDVAIDDDLAEHGHAGLRAALARLPPKQRGAVTYRYLGDLSYAEVAALLGSSEEAARRSAADGIANLRKWHRLEGIGERR
ncbi:MAG TPA: RNA polymerase sigma factor [Acidimicrobiales bacterium]|jgi:RNA polymerase sigma factor (sigma-70 family)|nr:RNA polymerase sigma factor [Acidimicrobiales bacterium]